MRLVTLLVAALVSVPAVAQQLVAPTGPLTPQEQRKKFHLPAGFEIQLVASEPDVNKPMNLEFDARGRLWVTHSLEYPFAAKDPAAARDAITIFSDLAPDGRARKAHRFAEHLNIPIGVLPLSDTEALAWSIPNIFKLTDTDHDGVADARSVVLGPFDYKDTHGNQNSFTRWVDGWVYANHGFSNNSKPKLRGAGDAPALEMQSGHTYRFRPDGSAAEIVSHGQVNPFGLTFDPLGNLFTADCHSRAVTMLLRGGYYPSFGKPHDGLGFAPETTNIDHGGTGIAGVVYYAADAFPPNFRDVLFVGNVITNRIHVDRLRWTGSTPKVESVENFLTCDDPWFRPVDIQLGPDGALYVADFYNKIIGHYEVPLTHPERDRERGRIWRIVYAGEGRQEITPVVDLTNADEDALLNALGHPNLIVRTTAVNVLLDRFPDRAVELARRAIDRAREYADDRRCQHTIAQAIWIVSRSKGPMFIDIEHFEGGAGPLVHAHLIRALGESAKMDPRRHALAAVRSAASAPDPFVRRAAAEAMAKHPAAENLPSLLKLVRETDPADAQLVHAARIAVRDQLRDEKVGAALATIQLDPADRAALLQIAAVTPTAPAALFIYDEAVRGNVSDDTLARAMPAAAKVVDSARADAMVELLAKRFAAEPSRQIDLLRAMFEGFQQRGAPPTARMRTTLTDLLRPAINGKSDPDWTNEPLPGAAAAAAAAAPSPWVIERRDCKDGRKDVPVISSLNERNPKGERLTGVLRSAAFPLPEKLTLWVCGHNGLPAQTEAKANLVRLVLEDGTEVARAYPPRNDVARPVTWGAGAHAGKRGRIEVVDALSLDAYAWIAVTRFEPAVVRVPEGAASLVDGSSTRAERIRLAGRCGLEAVADDVVAAAAATDGDVPVRLAAAETLLALRPAAAVAPLAALLADVALPVAQRQQAAQLLGRADTPDARAALLPNLRSAPQPVAVAIAAAVAGSKDGSVALLDEIRAGKASPALLREPTVVDRLRGAAGPDVHLQIAELTAKLSPADDRLAKLIADRRAAFLAAKPDAAAGKAVFAKSVCAQCHTLADVGGAVGPALDGIGNRGLDRLLEDVLDPNRNVDQAFRTTVVRTKKGQTYAGFNVREDGASLVMNDTAGGTEIRIPLADVDRRQASTLSPMPANVDQLMPEAEFQQLMAYLLSSRGTE